MDLQPKGQDRQAAEANRLRRIPHEAVIRCVTRIG